MSAIDAERRAGKQCSGSAEHVHCTCIAHALHMHLHMHCTCTCTCTCGAYARGAERGGGWGRVGWGGAGAGCRLLHLSSKSPPCTSCSSAHRRGTAPGSSGPPHASLPSTFRVYVYATGAAAAPHSPAGAPG